MEENFKRDSGAETDGSQVHELKAEIERLNRSLNRFQVILDQSEDILFEWNIVEDTLLCSDNYRKKMGYIPAGQKIFEHMRDTRYILDADRTEFLRIMREILGGRPYTEAEAGSERRTDPLSGAGYGRPPSTGRTANPYGPWA